VLSSVAARPPSCCRPWPPGVVSLSPEIPLAVRRPPPLRGFATALLSASSASELCRGGSGEHADGAGCAPRTGSKRASRGGDNTIQPSRDRLPRLGEREASPRETGGPSAGLRGGPFVKDALYMTSAATGVGWKG
jgi:hypothetical protein